MAAHTYHTRIAGVDVFVDVHPGGKPNGPCPPYWGRLVVGNVVTHADDVSERLRDVLAIHIDKGWAKLV